MTKKSAFQTAITVCDAINEIDAKKYLLPAIQREFVWKPEQIINLFDSMLKEYPIGSFLFWDAEKEQIEGYPYYEFIQEFHERNKKHNPEADVKSSDNITVILDGQQRLTALYIALKGSCAYRLPKKHWNKNKSFPKCMLYLNLLPDLRPNNGVDDVDNDYRLKFLSDEVSKNEHFVKDENNYWFKVGHILTLKDEAAVDHYLVENGLMSLDNKDARETLLRLHSMIHSDKIINYYLECSQELVKVLNIFIRVNNSGTRLSLPDLCLSTATAQWKPGNAREEIKGFVAEINVDVDDINKIRFRFNKDNILKSCLVLSDIPNIAFKVDNFNKKNMKDIVKQWDNIKEAIKTSVKLISSYGYTAHTLTPANAIIPIAYYLMKIGLSDDFVSNDQYYDDREKIKKWLARSLIKRVFDKPDTVLRESRRIIKECSDTTFPFDEIVASFKKDYSRDITFTDDDIEDLFDAKSGKKHTFSILALLYPSLDSDSSFHKDHIFPRKWFDQKKFDEKGINPEKQHFYWANRDTITNLQLLEDDVNKGKSGKDFKEWLFSKYKDNESRIAFMEKHYIPDSSLEFEDFEDFTKKRRELLKAKFKEILQ